MVLNRPGSGPSIFNWTWDFSAAALILSPGLSDAPSAYYQDPNIQVFRRQSALLPGIRVEGPGTLPETPVFSATPLKPHLR